MPRLAGGWCRSVSRPAPCWRTLPREEGNPWVIRGKLPGSHLTDLQRPRRRIRERAGLEDVRIHDLRHSYASRALALGESLTMIGKPLGHTQVETTARYAHLVEDSLRDSAVRISDSIAADILKSSGAGERRGRKPSRGLEGKSSS